MNLKIREAQLNKIPYMLVVGDKEMENNTVSVRVRNGEDRGSQKFDEFMSNLKALEASRELEKL